MYEAERFDWCCLLLEEIEIDDLVDAVPGAVYEDVSDALVDIDISDPLLFVEIKEDRATPQLAMNKRLRVAIPRFVM